MTIAVPRSHTPRILRGHRASHTLRRDSAAICAIALCALALHRDGLFGGPAFYELDTRLFYFPLAHWVGQQLQSGHFPLWLSGIFTGYPIFADGELGLAYLPQVAALSLLPTPVAMVWLRVLHVFLAGTFTFLFLRTLGLKTLPALGGAIVFSCGSFLSAQMHHENVVRSAVWLPAVLLCLERATWSRPRRSVAWAALGALAFAQAALGLHVQPVLMAALAIAGYGLFRLWRSPRTVLAATATILAGGLLVAAVQWLPLGEWALVSTRRGGVDYTFASAFAIAPATLLSVVFPYFFRLSDAATWWSLWQQWEIELYVGVPTLALVVVGSMLSRRTEVVYFVLLGLLSLWIAMAEYAPLVNLHQLLWSVPGFSFLRAPGRFSYLIVFSCACLAAFGLQVLRESRHRRMVALIGGAPAAIALVATVAIFHSIRDWLLADSTRAIAWAQSNYLANGAQYPIDPELVVGGFVTSLDPSNLKTEWSLVLLGVTALLFLGRLGLGSTLTQAGQACFVILIAIDLLVFAYDFHPQTPLAELTPTFEQSRGERLLLHDATDLPGLEPDQLLAEGIPTAGGYSSLPSQRHVELEAATSSDPRLFDLWGAPLILEPSQPADLRTVDGVRFRSQHPLVSGFGESPPQVLEVPTGVGTVSGLRIIGTLGYAYNVPQGQTVAMLTFGDMTVPIRAGVELAERAYDRPSLKGLLQHQIARIALNFEEVTPAGEAYMAHLYEADLPAATSTCPDRLRITFADPNVQVELYGIATLDTAGAAHSLDFASREGMQRVSDDLLRDTHALPRGYTLARTQAFSPSRHPGLTATQLVASPDVDLHTMVLIENDPSMPDAPPDSSEMSPVRPAEAVTDLGPNAVRVSATVEEPSYLVLEDFYHRGWTARVDGQPSRVLIANALFRAVALPPGTHSVEFRFEPLSHRLGAAISALALLLALVAISWGFGARRGGAGLGRPRQRQAALPDKFAD